MNHDLMRDDIEFLKKEIRLGIDFLKSFFKDEYETAKFKRKVKAWEYSPFKRVQFAIVLIISVFCLFQFELYRSQSGLILLAVIFFAFHDLMFDRSWTGPIVVAIWAGMKEIFQGVWQLIQELFQALNPFDGK